MVDIVDIHGKSLRAQASAFSAADPVSRELGTWQPSALSGDAAILPGKSRMDSRTKDLVRNNGIASSGINLHLDSIVGAQFKLIAKPNWLALGIDPESDYANDWVKHTEALWTSYAEDAIDCPMDAEGKRTFTQLIRSGMYHHVIHGEDLGTAEWKERAGHQFNTCFKIISPDRLCNPEGKRNSDKLRGGVELGRNNEAEAYFIRTSHQSDGRLGVQNNKWRRIAKKKSWGRYQVIHIFDPMEDGQTRGHSGFSSVLKRLKMLDKFQEVVLQNAIVNAMYAMVIESELDTTTALEAIGASGEDSNLAGYLGAIQEYHQGANVTFDGVKIPHLFPGEKLNMQTAKSPMGVEQYEQGLLRYVASGLNVSYEQLSRDYSKTNYSSARASMMETQRHFAGKRQFIAKRKAGHLYALWLEEAFSKGLVELPKGAPTFWQAKSAWCRSDWIGAGQSHIDGLKEAKRLVLLIEAGLMTEEKAHAELGQDYQDVFTQLMREKKEREDKGLPPPLWMQTAKMSTSVAYQEVPEVNTNSQTA